MQTAAATVADVALMTRAGLLARVNPHVDHQV